MGHADLPSPFARKKAKPLDGSTSVPWSPLIGVAVVLVVFFAAQIIAVLLVQLAYVASGAPKVSLDSSTTAQFLFTVFAETLTIGAVIAFMRIYKVKLSAIGLKKPRWVDLAYGLSAVPIYFVIYLVVVGLAAHTFTGLDVNQKQQIGFESVHGTLPLVLTFVSLAILPPLAEEIIVRGFLYTSLRKGLRFIPAMIITSLIFAAAHLPEGGASGPLYIAAIDTFVLSLVLVYLREKTDSLWPGIVLHAIKNGVAFVALFVVGAR